MSTALDSLLDLERLAECLTADPHGPACEHYARQAAIDPHERDWGSDAQTILDQACRTPHGEVYRALWVQIARLVDDARSDAFAAGVRLGIKQAVEAAAVPDTVPGEMR